MNLEQTILPGIHAWKMADNVPMEFVIEDVRITIAHDHKASVCYTLRTLSAPFGYMATETIYFTKQHLLNSL